MRTPSSVAGPLLGLVAALGTTACPGAGDEASDFRKAIPTEDTVKLQVPGTEGQALQVEGEGKTSRFYKLTRHISRDVNGGVYLVLALVRAVVAHRPTSLADNTATWGPFSDALDPIAWKVTVTRTSPEAYAYTFEGQPKANPAAPFETVLSGTHRPRLDANGEIVEGFGEGNFLLDFEARNRLPLPERDVGSAAVTYARPGLASPVQITATFVKVRDEERPGRLVDVDYAYTREVGGSGKLVFAWRPDPAAITDGPADLSVTSLWTAAGAGRSDVVGTKGTLPAGTQATASECWDTSFASVYLATSWAPAINYGTPDLCALPAMP
ncbi:MAG: hypothetical protein KA712_24225 [Myxococcales bacterium]|nr:hypothetical protein [Myxococcales bacterium]